MGKEIRVNAVIGPDLKKRCKDCGKTISRIFMPMLVFLFLSSFIIREAWAGPTYYLTDLIEAVRGKTQEEVRSLLGSPNKVYPTQADATGSWEYGYADRFTWGMHWNVLEDTSGIPCWVVDVDFENGRAVTVSVSRCME